MTLIIERRHNDGFIVSEIDTGRLSRDQGTLAAGQKVPAGCVLGVVLGTSATFQAQNGNAGNGVFSAIGVAGTAVAGGYVLTVLTATVGATHGTFSLIEPNGTALANGTLGTAYTAGGLSFTLSDGSPPLAVGDGFVIVAGGQYAAFDPTASDGSQTAAALALNDTDATLGAVNIGVLTRLAEINATEVVWGPNVTTTTQQLLALQQLATKQIVARHGEGVANYQ
jgi:hypothetical protein